MPDIHHLGGDEAWCSFVSTHPHTQRGEGSKTQTNVRANTWDSGVAVSHGPLPGPSLLDAWPITEIAKKNKNITLNLFKHKNFFDDQSQISAIN